MKLATLKNGSRDGKLVVVSRDLTRFTDASFLAPTLQAALDDWRRISPHLATLAESLETGSVPSSRFHENDAQSPLPRAYQHSRGVDAFTGPRDPILLGSTEVAMRVEASVALITGDLPMGADARDAAGAMLLVALAGTIRSSATTQGQRAGGVASLSPVAVTPDELGKEWDTQGMALPLLVGVAGKPAVPQAQAENAKGFAELVAEVAKTRPLTAGAIIDAGAGDPDGSMVLNAGDTVRIEMKDSYGQSIFGAIEQTAQHPQT